MKIMQKIGMRKGPITIPLLLLFLGLIGSIISCGSGGVFLESVPTLESVSVRAAAPISCTTTYYWIFDPRQEPVDPSGTIVDLLDPDGQVLISLDENLAKRYSMEERGFLPDGRMIIKNPDGPGFIILPYDPLTPWGPDANGDPLLQWKSVAVDPLVIPVGTPLYIEEFDGFLLPDDSVHDGWFTAAETSYSFSGNHIDLFVGDYHSWMYIEDRFPSGSICHVLPVTPGLVINAAAGPGGEISPAGLIDVVPGDSVTFQFIPDPGKVIVAVLVDGVDIYFPGMTSYTFTDIVADHSIEVIYGDEFSCDLQKWNSDTVYLAGDLVHYGGADWKAKWWTRGDEPGTQGEWGVWDFQSECIDNRIFYISGSSGPNGQAVPEGTALVPGGSSFTVGSAPDAGYIVKSAIVDGVDKGPLDSWTFENVSSDHNVRFLFEPVIVYEITLVSGPNGMVNPAGVVLVPAGTDLVVEILPSPGFSINEIVVDGILQNVSGYTYEFANVQDRHTFEVTFAAFGPPPWEAGVFYSKGAMVNHSGRIYECQIDHTSNSAWPPGLPGLWLWELQV